MMGLNLATVYEQVPAQHGVRVVWRNLQFQGSADKGSQGESNFVRVGASRAHPTDGSVTNLPSIGELGLVATIDEEVSVWICSLHWQDNNSIVPGQTFWRHDSGMTIQANEGGESQIDFPGGVCLRSTILDAPLVVPTGPNVKDPGAGATTYLALEHPSGLTININPNGDIAINRAGAVAVTAVYPISMTGFGTFNITTLPITSNPTQAQDWPGNFTQPVIDINVNSGGKLNLTSTGDTVVNAGGNLNLNATGTVNLQGGASRFIMEGVVTWLTTHTHPVSGAVASASATVVPAAAYSPTTLKGSHG